MQLHEITSYRAVLLQQELFGSSNALRITADSRAEIPRNTVVTKVVVRWTPGMLELTLEGDWLIYAKKVHVAGVEAYLHAPSLVDIGIHALPPSSYLFFFWFFFWFCFVLTLSSIRRRAGESGILFLRACRSNS